MCHVAGGAATAVRPPRLSRGSLAVLGHPSASMRVLEPSAAEHLRRRDRPTRPEPSVPQPGENALRSTNLFHTAAVFRTLQTGGEPRGSRGGARGGRGEPWKGGGIGQRRAALKVYFSSARTDVKQMALASVNLKPRHVVAGLDDDDHKTMIYRMALKAAGPGAPELAYIGRARLGTGPVEQLLSDVHYRTTELGAS